MRILDDLLSKDPTRIWSAAGAIRTLRDLETLAQLAAHLPEIKRRTSGVNLGGALRPNASHLEFALRKLEFVRSGSGCLCRLYPEDDFYDPQREAADGHVDIVESIVDAGAQSHVMVCRCAHCGQRYTADERQYHYTWWAWVPL